MANSLGTLTLDLIARIGGFIEPLDKAARESQKRMAEIKNSAVDAGKTLGTGIASGAAVAATALTAMVVKQLEVIGNQDDMAARLGTSVESLATLTRAAELSGVSLEQLEGAGQKLELALGKASQGSKAQVEALDRLGLSYQELSGLDLDQRITTINAALAKNIPLTEQAAVAATLFGAKNAAAIRMLDPDTIAEAARQAKVFGLNLSSVDSAKVEMAGDALSSFSLVLDGIGKQLTIELAPVLSAIGEQFVDSAEEAGGLGTAVQDSVRTAVSALAFLVDAGDGVKRVFEVVADTIIGTITTASGYATRAVATLIDTLDAIPGVDLSETAKSVRDFSEEQLAIAREAANGIQETLDAPLAGTAFKQFYEDAQKAGQVAAEAAVAGKKLVDTGKQTGAEYKANKEAADELAKATEKAAAAIQSQIDSLELQAATVGFTTKQETLFKLALDGATQSQLDQAEAALDAVDAFEKQKKAQEDYKDLVSELRTEEEQLTDQLRERLRIIEAMPDVPENERRKLASRAIDEGFSDAPQFAGLDPSVGGPFGEMIKVDKAEAELEDWYAKQLEMLEQNRKDRADLTAEWDAKEMELKAQHEQGLLNLENARQVTALAGAESLFGNLANLTRTFYGEESATYQAVFLAQQALAIATTVMNAEMAAAAALAPPPFGLGPVAGLPYSQLIRGIGYASAAVIGAQTVTGMAHAGIDKIPADGTWFLQKGERVTTAETSAKLDNTLAQVQAGMAGGGGRGGGNTYNISLPGVTNAREAREASAAVQRSIARGVAGSGRYA